MNVEFHYYSTAFLAVKAGFSLEDATTLAHASQYVDHHLRALEIQTTRGTVLTGPTQNFSFWDPATVASVLAPFHFFPGGTDSEGKLLPSVRADGGQSVWEVRPSSPGPKALLVEALQSRDLYRIGIALHTFSDTWAHQNFTARDEAWNRLDPSRHLPAPGHAHAGTEPDLWLAQWTDPRLKQTDIRNMERFTAAARKVYRFLCVFQGREFRDEEAVLEGLQGIIEAGRGRDSVEDRMIEFVLELNLEPYDRTRWLAESLETPETGTGWPLLDRWKKVGEELLDRTGLSGPQAFRAKPGFEATPLAAWIRAADVHRTRARSIIAGLVGAP